jgi:LAGLIDADG endonuclease
LIEGEGSFYLDRKELKANFSIGLSEVQLPVIERIKVFLESNLPFDKYSKFKLKNSSCISIGFSSNGRENSKPFVRLVVRNTNILTNYLIPYLDNIKFISKKSKDFEDFKIICTSLYNGTYRNDEIKSLLVKLSYSMNNYRLSTNADLKKIKDFSQDDLGRIVNAKLTIIHLSDGRQVDSITRKEVNIRWTNCVYEIVNNLGEITLVSTLNEAGTILNVDFRTVKKYLETEALHSKEGFSEIKNKKVRRIPVFYPSSK